MLRRSFDVYTEGADAVPPAGPVLIAARHYHHLYDACVFLATLPRPLSFVVALDWVDRPALRRLMEWACRTARWPVVLRSEALRDPMARAHRHRSAYSAAEVPAYLRRAVADTVGLLVQGRAVVVFPEGYPNIDPVYSPKGPAASSFMPFRPGFVRFVILAERAARQPIPIVPAGLHYSFAGRRAAVWLRFGGPWYVPRAAWSCSRAEQAEIIRRFIAAIESEVQALSHP
jgi:1-acyl-sn-glycerol-3-phosphate acyltransferase